MNNASTFNPKTTVSILGCGWYGLALAKALISDGIHVKGSTTSAEKMETLKTDGIDPYLLNFGADEEVYSPAFFDCDVLFIAIPPKARSGEGALFIYKIRSIIDCIKLNKVQNVVFISSTGVYADLNTEVNELTDPQPNTEAGKVLFAAEELFRAETGFKTTIVRFAGLIGPGRNPGRFFAGKSNIPNGNAPVNLIQLNDCIGLSKAILTRQAFGHLFNGCSPEHPKRSEFYTKAALESGLEAPLFIDELKEWKIVTSINVEQVLGYEVSGI
ncbi:SDR family oxidoreductase [Mucilaginibacter flavus]|uniref:SDR family oxidoreductase n=1 Tax=Mucilaginibacter flavus TaxID=931504 RepID=UPI0025B53810|nr:SDR family oxidoreductase [Mucilaginibacter flavus]MDN3582925.1 SDR family oxidoreductase [Mucilaginibacter flavus]